MGISKLSVILPCFNEEGNLPIWESDLFPVLDRLPFPVECIVIDDGSTDGTHAAAHHLAGRRTGVRVIRHAKNRGLGAAIRTGLAACQGDAVLTLDSDLTFPPATIAPLIAAFGPGVDCVCASPFLGRFQGVALSRRLLCSGVNLVYRRLLGRPLTAVSSICRLYRRESLAALPLASDSFDINAEIIFLLARAGARIVEVPSILAARRFGVSKISTGREIRNHLRMFARILLWRGGSVAARVPSRPRPS